MKHTFYGKEARFMDRLFNATEFGKRLKKYRNKKHLSQMQLSELIGSSPASVSHLENGTHSPSLETLIKLSTALGIGIDELLADSLPAVTNIHLDKDIQNSFPTAHCKKRKF